MDGRMPKEKRGIEKESHSSEVCNADNVYGASHSLYSSTQQERGKILNIGGNTIRAKSTRGTQAGGGPPGPTPKRQKPQETEKE